MFFKALESTSEGGRPDSGDSAIAGADITYLLGARITLLLVSLLSAAYCTLFGAIDGARQMQFMYGPMQLLFALSIASCLWLKWRSNTGRFFTWAQLLLDVIIVTGVVYLTGGAVSPFLFLYLLLCMGGTFVFSRRTGFAVSAASTLAYCGLVWLMVTDVIPPADGSLQPEIPASGLMLQVLGLLSGLILVTILTSFLVRKVVSSYKLIAESRKELLSVIQKQQVLIDGIPAGVITIHMDGTIASINQLAREILSLAEPAVLGKQLKDVLRRLDENCSDFDPALLNIGTPQELSLSLANGNAGARIIYHGQPIVSDADIITGAVFFFQDVTKLRSIEEQLEMQERMARLLARRDPEPAHSATQLKDFVGESLVMRKVFGLIERVARSDATVLISGESGTGKELVAKAIHAGGTRNNKTFVPLNCGAIPENLIESELFGHRKGSFTGADSDYAGLFRQAEGGTVFLDEIGELPLHMQTKLLRAIQEKRVRPVGGERDIPVDVRIVAATNRNLRKEVEAGKFREDLFYRLNVISISLPPLRDRREDIPLLVNSILVRLLDGEAVPMVPPATMQLLMKYDYPGNVRELENILERALVLGGQALLPEHVPDIVRTYQSTENSQKRETTIIVDETLQFPINLDQLLCDIERRYLESALSESQGVKKRAAELLGMNFRSFRYRLQKFGLGDGE